MARNPVEHYSKYRTLKVSETLLKLLLSSLARMPLAVNHYIGIGIGLCLYWLPTKSARLTRINLALCFPNKSSQWHKKMSRLSLMESAKILTEAPYLWRSTPEQLQRLVLSVKGEDVLNSALNNNKGIIFITPHLGCWEITSLFMGTRLPLTCLYRPSRVTALDEPIRNSRQNTGARLVPATAQGLKSLLHALRQRQCIGILPDQVPRFGRGVLAPFFSLPAYTMVLVSRLALKNRIPVILIWANRQSAGKGYHLEMQALPNAFYHHDITTSVIVMNNTIETLVRNHPEQYAWSYKRFRKILPEQPDLYE